MCLHALVSIHSPRWQWEVVLAGGKANHHLVWCDFRILGGVARAERFDDRGCYLLPYRCCAAGLRHPSDLYERHADLLLYCEKLQLLATVPVATDDVKLLLK